MNTTSIAVIRWIDDSNAASLGYDDEPKYLHGAWVLETCGGEWKADLDGIGATQIDVAQREAGFVVDADPADTTWKPLNGNYGAAYELVRA